MMTTTKLKGDESWGEEGDGGVSKAAVLQKKYPPPLKMPPPL